MPVVSDYSVILGDGSVQIGDANPLWGIDFGTGGRHAQGQSLLMLMVRALTEAARPVNVRINNEIVGEISPHNGAFLGHWFTQIIHFPSNVLNNGDNHLLLEAVPKLQGAEPGDALDDYSVRDVVCFFKQDV